MFSPPPADIELALTKPEGTPRAVAVVCHPHPLYGGAMSNKVVYALASSLQKHGAWVLRFNFRGVGKSAGTHDHGRGETEDTIRLALWLREQHPDLPLLLAGFSFGAFIALKSAAMLKPALLVTVAPPFKYFESEARPPHPGCPWLVLHSTDDEVVDYQSTQAELMRYQPNPELITLNGAGHFFHGKLGDISQALAEWLPHHGFPA